MLVPMRLCVALAVLTAPISLALADTDPCASGLAAAQRGKPVAAFVSLETCIGSGLAKAEHEATHRRVRRDLDAGNYALVTIATTPPGVAVVVAPIELAVASGRVYLPPGKYTLEVNMDGYVPLSRPLEITGRYRETVELALVEARAKKPGTTTVDLTGEPGRTEIARGKDPEHENLIPDRFRRGQPGDTGGGETNRRSSWPYAVLAVGLVAAGVGVGFHLNDRAGVATALYATGGVATALGATGLILRW